MYFISGHIDYHNTFLLIDNILTRSDILTKPKYTAELLLKGHPFRSAPIFYRQFAVRSVCSIEWSTLLSRQPCFRGILQSNYRQPFKEFYCTLLSLWICLLEGIMPNSYYIIQRFETNYIWDLWTTSFF